MVNHKQRWEFKIGVPVEAIEGPVGRLRQVVLDPGDSRVASLVVRRGGLPARDSVVPVEAVESASDDAIKLKLTKDEVDALPLFQQQRYFAPASDAGGYS